MFCIVGDLGGTNLRLRLINFAQSITLVEDPSNGIVVYEKKYYSSHFDSFTQALDTFYHDLNLYNDNVPITYIIVCVAGPCVAHVLDDKYKYITSQITALHWNIDTRVLSAEFEVPLDNVVLINDFEAIGFGILGLSPDNFIPLNDRPSATGAPIAVVGPGTGLGVCFLVKDANSNFYNVLPAEGGHCSYSPTELIEFELLKYIQKEFKTDHVSNERIASGTGMQSVYRFLKHKENPEAEMYFPENAALAYAHDNVLSYRFPAQLICESAVSGDPICADVLHIFSKALATSAQNLALSTLCFGGLFIAGGMGAKLEFLLNPKYIAPPPKIPPLIPLEKSLVDPSFFINQFRNAGRISNVLSDIPVKLVVREDVGMIGCAVICGRLLTRREQLKNDSQVLEKNELIQAQLREYEKLKAQLERR